MNGEFSDDAFKIASIACQLSKGHYPKESDLHSAINLLRRSEQVHSSSREGDDLEAEKHRDLTKTTFKELLQESTEGREYADLGKITTISGVRDKIKKVFPSDKQLEAFRLCRPSLREIEAWRLTRPATEKDSLSEIFLRAKNSGIPESMWFYFQYSISPRSAKSISDSRFVDDIEQLHLVSGNKVKYEVEV